MNSGQKQSSVKREFLFHTGQRNALAKMATLCNILKTLWNITSNHYAENSFISVDSVEDTTVSSDKLHGSAFAAFEFVANAVSFICKSS